MKLLVELTCRLFCWVPVAVHWFVSFLPLLLTYGLAQVFDPLPVALYSVGAAIHFYLQIMHPGCKEERLAPVLEVRDDAPTIKKNVVVIGAGPAGVATCKELVEAGHEVTCYDQAGSIGGVFGSYFWPEGRLTSSPYVTCYSDYEAKKDKNGKEHWSHFSANEYVEYMKSYADHFGFTDSVHLRHKVLHVKQDESKKVFVHVKDLKSGKERVDGPFDHVAICSGAFHSKFIPKIPGLDTFKGKILHTRDFSSTTTDRTIDEAFGEVAGKRVVTIGLGESMADILGIISSRLKTPTTYCAAAIRKGAFVIPRINPLTGENNDFDTTRVRYALPKFIHNLTFVICTMLTNIFEFRKSGERRVRYDLMMKIPKLGPAYVTTTKSEMFLAPVVDGKVEIKPSIQKIDGNKVYFSDGTVSEDIDALLFGTGFGSPKFPFLDESSFYSTETGEKLSEPQTCPPERLLRMFDPRLGSTVAYIGLGVRPLIGSIPTSTEMQARVFALVVSGKRALPSMDIMKERVETMKAQIKREFSVHNENWMGVVNWIPFMDMCAREIGCLPKRRWLFTRPRLGLKLLVGPMSSYHYRLTGHGAKPDIALDIIRRIPYSHRLKDSLFFLGLHYTLSLFNWPHSALLGVAGAASSMVKPLFSSGKVKKM